MTRWLVMVSVAAALAGCQDDPGPPGSPSDSVSAMASATSDPSASASPSSAPPSSADPDPTSGPSASEGTNASDRTYGVAFAVPGDWERGDDDPRWSGDDGFVQLDAVTDGAGDAEDTCAAMAEHGLEPYGSSPTIETLVIDEQEACLVLPSDDQAPELEDQAAIVARYPQAREISGETYTYVALYVDEPHVRHIAASLRFIS